jgi:hypothetical protein
LASCMRQAGQGHHRTNVHPPRIYSRRARRPFRRAGGPVGPPPRPGPAPVRPRAARIRAPWESVAHPHSWRARARMPAASSCLTKATPHSSGKACTRTIRCGRLTASGSTSCTGRTPSARWMCGACGPRANRRSGSHTRTPR